MTVFTVVILPSAERDLDRIRAHVHEDSPAAAAALIDQFEDAFLSLETFPLRCPRVHRRRAFGWPVRRLLCSNYQILFTVRAPLAIVLRLLHGAQRIPWRLVRG